MGYQQSLVQFNNKEDLIKEFVNYTKRDTKKDSARVYGINKTVKPIAPFKKDELMLVVGGERYEQRTPENLEEGLGIKNAKHIVFIDNMRFHDLSNGNLGAFLDKHFKTLTEKEHDDLINKL